MTATLPAGSHHGTSTAYVKHRCRCPACSEWQRQRMRDYHDRRRAPTHDGGGDAGARDGYDLDPVADLDPDDEDDDDLDPDDDDYDDDDDDYDDDDDDEGDEPGPSLLGQSLRAAVTILRSPRAPGTDPLAPAEPDTRPAPASLASFASRARTARHRSRRLVTPVTRALDETARRHGPPSDPITRARRYIPPGSHRPLHDRDVACTHALTVPAGTPLPTVARCPRCDVARLVVAAGARLGDDPTGALDAPTAADLEAAWLALLTDAAD